MKYIYINLRKVGALLIILFTLSCSDSFLELKPAQSLELGDALTSMKDFRVAVNGMYDRIAVEEYYNRYFVLLPDIMSDDVKQNVTANRGKEMAQYIHGSDHFIVEDMFRDAYEAIGAANQIIATDIVVAESDQAEFDDLKGQAYAMRALIHFDMVRIFAQHYTFTPDASHIGVKYSKTPIKGKADLDSFDPARNTVKEVYDNLVADFLTAIDLLEASDDKFRLTKQGAQALLSRVYLYKEDWTNAVAMATEVIENGEDLSLIDSAEYIEKVWGKDQNFSSESIFEISNTDDDNEGGSSIAGMYLKAGFGDYLPSEDLLDLIPATDVRHLLFKEDSELEGDFCCMRVNKYSTNTGTDNIKVIRLAEVILIRAEALSHLEKDPEAQADLNLIRQMRRPTAADVISTGVTLLDEILLERRIEIAFEGQRLWDLARYKKDVVRVNCTAPQEACNIAYPDDRFAMPIPADEVATTGVQQNPGY